MSAGSLRIIGRCFIMAKELPYFKFEPAQWENGNIQVCSFEAQGIFIHVCSMYWQRLGNLPYKLAVQKICKGNAVALDSLIEEDVIKVIDGHICIDFLNEQLAEFESTSKVNSENARQGWLKRRNNATALQTQSDPNAIREEKIREDKRKEDKTNTTDAVLVWPSFEDFWNAYDKKEDKPKCEKKWKKIEQRAREKIMQHLELYVRSTPDKQYRKNPYTYLNSQSWENEIVTPSTNGKSKLTASGTLDRLNSYSD